MERTSPLDRAAQYYSLAHHTTIHKAYESKTFEKYWNRIKDNPNDTAARKALGLGKRRLDKEGREEEKEMQRIRKFGETP